MHSATSLECSGLVRSVGLCAQTRARVAIATHSRLKWWHKVLHIQGLPSRLLTLKRNERQGGVFFVIPVKSPVDLTFKWSVNIAFAYVRVEQLLFTCNEGYCLDFP